MIIDNDVEQHLNLSIAGNRLILLCGAGLSMAPPSSLPSAQVLAEHCWTRYNKTATIPLDNALKNDLEALSKYFLNKGLFNQFINIIVPWDEFDVDFNKGHSAVADFLATDVLQSAISTNYDCLIEHAVHSLGKCDFAGCLNPFEVHGGMNPFHPLHKPHGCCSNYEGKHRTVWCPEQLANDPIKSQITTYKTWLEKDLMGKDILITGFWSNWDYLNDLLFTSITLTQPNNVIVIDPSDSATLSAKAPRLWSWANSGAFWFKHVQASATDFLDELRYLVSRIIFRNLLNDSLIEYQSKYGIAYTGPIDLDPVLTTDELYMLRRNLEGVLSNTLLRTIKTRNEQHRFGAVHLRLLELGATLSGTCYTHHSKKVRIIQAAGEVLSAVKNNFSFERPASQMADITICAGALPDAASSHIIRGGAPPSIIRPGLKGDWMTDDEYFSTYTAVTP